MWRQKVYAGTLRILLPMAESMSGLISLLKELTKLSYNNRPPSYNAPNVSMIEPGLYLGDGFSAMDVTYLLQENFTYVLNMAEGYGHGLVCTNEKFYRNTGITYYGVQAYDRSSFPLDQYFMDSVKFIEEALSNGGKILVHCVMGVSRSASIIIAYLIITKQMRASTALRFVYEKRWIRPNNGFLRQLAGFSNTQEARVPLH